MAVFVWHLFLIIGLCAARSELYFLIINLCAALSELIRRKEEAGYALWDRRPAARPGGYRLGVSEMMKWPHGMGQARGGAATATAGGLWFREEILVSLTYFSYLLSVTHRR
jgi:hypothetical protein